MARDSNQAVALMRGVKMFSTKNGFQPFLILFLWNFHRVLFVTLLSVFKSWVSYL